jgi:hypothetical protein
VRSRYFNDFVAGFDDPSCPCDDLGARWRQDRASRLTLDEGHAKIILQFLQLSRESWLADEAALSGFAEMSRVCHSDEVAKIFEFDVSHPGYPLERFIPSIEIITSIDWYVEGAAARLFRTGFRRLRKTGGLLS